MSAHHLNFSVGQRIFYWIRKYPEWMSPQSFIFRASGLFLEKKGSHGNAFLFVCFNISLVLQGMSLHPTGGLRNLKTLTCNTLTLKTESMLKKCGTLVFSTHG